jgi:hypothetical protein
MSFGSSRLILKNLDYSGFSGSLVAILVSANSFLAFSFAAWINSGVVSSTYLNHIQQILVATCITEYFARPDDREC